MENQIGKSIWKINILISTRKIKKKIELRKSVEINLIVFFFLSVICKQARPSIITRCIRRCSTTCTTRESAWPVVFIRDSPRPRHLRSTLTRTPIRTRTTWRASRVCNWPPRRTPWWVVSHNYSQIEGCSKKKKKFFFIKLKSLPIPFFRQIKIKPLSKSFFNLNSSSIRLKWSSLKYRNANMQEHELNWIRVSDYSGSREILIRSRARGSEKSSARFGPMLFAK